VLVLRSEATGETRRVLRQLRVGRDGSNDLVLPSGTVSSFHAVLEWRDGGWFLRDLGSSNGTAVDGERVTGWAAVKASSRLEFGPDNAWQVDVAKVAAAQNDRGTYLEAEQGGAKHPVAEDRFTIGTGDGFDLALHGDDALLAVLYQENDRCRVVAFGDGVEVDGEPVLPDEPVVLPPGGRLSVHGRTWLFVIGGSHGVATVEAGLKAKSYGRYRLTLTSRGDFGDIELHDGARLHRWPDQDRRFLLLWVLAEALKAATDGPAWVDDEATKLAVWGRRAAEGLSGSTLSKLIHDTRAMLGRDGVDGLFIEKKRGRTRLRLDRAAVDLVG
jgi:hypothetical protein